MAVDTGLLSGKSGSEPDEGRLIKTYEQELSM
jgi:hypothetical protein